MMKKKSSIPAYQLPIQPDIQNGTLEYRGEIDGGIVSMHTQEIVENAGDHIHFETIHSHLMVPFTNLEIPFIHKWLRIHHEPRVIFGKDEEAKEYGKQDPHLLYFITYSSLMYKNKIIETTRAIAKIIFLGPGGILVFRFSVPQYGDIVLFHSQLPVYRMKLHVKFHYYANKNIPRIIVWYVVGMWLSQWHNDIDIWATKIFYHQPCVVKGDGPIMKVRQWMKQFYYYDNSNKINYDDNGNNHKNNNENNNENDNENENLLCQSKDMAW